MMQTFYNFLNEEYFDVEYIEDITIFKNPTLKELIELNKEHPYVRVIVDFKKKDVYVWTGLRGIHPQVISRTKLSKFVKYNNNINFLSAVGKIHGNRIHLSYSDQLMSIASVSISPQEFEGIKLIAANDNWSKKYFDDFAGQTMLKMALNYINGNYKEA